MEPEARSGKPAKAAVETAHLIGLLERSSRLLESTHTDSSRTRPGRIVNLQMARDEVVNGMLRLNAQIAELTCTQDQVRKARLRLERELANLE